GTGAAEADPGPFPRPPADEGRHQESRHAHGPRDGDRLRSGNPAGRGVNPGLVPGLRHREALLEAPHVHGEGSHRGCRSTGRSHQRCSERRIHPDPGPRRPGWGDDCRAARCVPALRHHAGPLLFDDEPRLVWGLLVSFLIGHLLLLVLNLPLAPVFAQLLRLPSSYLYPLLILTALIGAFAVANNTFSPWVVVVFGVVGFLMKRITVPIAPLVLGLVIGPLFEKALVQSSALGGGDLMKVVLASPTAVGILIVAFLLLLVPAVVNLVRGRSRQGLGIGDDLVQ